MTETMTTEEVAEVFKVTQPTVYRWVKEGELPASRIGRTLRFNRDDVERMLHHNGESSPVPVQTNDADTLRSLIRLLADEVETELRRRGTL